MDPNKLDLLPRKLALECIVKAIVVQSQSLAGMFILCLCSIGSHAQELDISSLFKQLETLDTSQSAALVIVKRAKDSHQDRALVANALPSMMDRAVDGTVVSNEMLIAGDLQVTECIPELMKYYIKGDAGGFITWSRVERLANDPAGLALSKIGRPVIPEMQRLLGSDNLDLRRKAVRVLINMHSEAADTVLQQHLAVESDEYVKRLINGAIAKGQTKK